MDFALDDDHLALADAVRRFCDGEHPREQRGDPPSPALAASRWAALAGLGLPGLMVPVEHGGMGLGAVEAMLAGEELGRALAGGAWVSTAAVCAPLIASLGTPQQRARWLPAIAGGRLRVAFAAAEPEARYALHDVATTARADGDGWRLDGRKATVPDGDEADLLVVVARAGGGRRDREGLALFAIDADSPGLQVRGFGTLDGRRAAHLALDGVRAGADRLLGTPGAAWPAVEEAADRACAALVADAAGAMRALAELTAEHLRTRTQFGAPLARFQALQHRIADAVIAVEQARSMASVAAMAVDEGDPLRRARAVSAAKAWVGPAGRELARAAIQMHGAMGMTDACRAGHYAKRLIAIGQLWGDADHHLARFAACEGR